MVFIVALSSSDISFSSAQKWVRKGVRKNDYKHEVFAAFVTRKQYSVDRTYKMISLKYILLAIRVSIGQPRFIDDDIHTHTHTPLCNFSTKSGPEFSYTLYWKGRTINI